MNAKTFCLYIKKGGSCDVLMRMARELSEVEFGRLDNRLLPVSLFSLPSNTELLSLLLKKGLNPNGVSETGDSFFFSSIYGYCGKNAEKLLENGCSFSNLVDEDGWAPEHFICGTDEPFYHKASLNIVLRLMINKGLDVNRILRCSQETPLHLASAKGNLSCMKELLAAGADPLSKDSKGKTPLDSALESDRLEALSVLKAWLEKQHFNSDIPKTFNKMKREKL